MSFGHNTSQSAARSSIRRRRHALLRFGWGRAAAAGSAGVLAMLVLVAPSGGAQPTDPDPAADSKPTIAEVQKQIESLNHQAEIASENLNAAREKLSAARIHLDTLRRDLDRQRTVVGQLRAHVVGAELADYQSASGVSASTSFLVADDPHTFLTDLANSQVADTQQADLLTRFTQEQRELEVQDDQAKEELAAIADDKQRLAEHKADLKARTADAQDLLDTLEAQERRRLERLQARQEARSEARADDEASRDATRTPTTDVPASGRAGVAVQTALAQIGDPYVYGAAGPDSFDCSGLTMYAWAAAGVSIPHASSMQPGAGTPVSVSSLQPGDLVFYYSPISHVGMYIGNGQIVHAPHTGSYVQIVPLDSMPIAMAVRIG